tara:strand:- start:491 stop:676 length:186 start_codon:yes stop_codon:yes gene_type:complete
MKNPTRKAVSILDMVLIFMTATWILFGIYRGITLLELIYNWTFVIVNITALILNLRLITQT